MANKSSLPGFMDFDVTRIMADSSKYFSDLKLPGVDVDSLVASQKKNIDTLTQANRVAYEGVQALMKRQFEVLRQTMEEVTALAPQLTATATPTERLARQTELTKDAFEKTVSYMREVSEMAARSNTEVVDLLNSRFSQSLEELKSSLEKLPSAPFPMPGFDGKPVAAKPVAPAAKPAAKSE